MIHFTKQDLIIKIEDARDSVDFLQSRIQELIDLHKKLEPYDDEATINYRGKILGKKPIESSYSIVKHQAEIKASYHRKMARFWGRN